MDQLKSLYPQADALEEDPNWSRWHENLYDPQFSRLMAENESYGPLVQGIVDIDYDPLCGCQDTVGPIRIFSMTPRPDGAVEIRMGDNCSDDHGGTIKRPDECSRLVIRRIRGAWRLYDVMEPASLRQRLVRHNACLRKVKTAEAANDCLKP